MYPHDDVSLLKGEWRNVALEVHREKSRGGVFIASLEC